MINTKDPLRYISEYDNLELLTTITIPDEENSYSADELKNIFSNNIKNTKQSNSIEEAVKSTVEHFQMLEY